MLVSKALDITGLELESNGATVKFHLSVADLERAVTSDSPTGIVYSGVFDVQKTKGVTLAVYDYPTSTDPHAIMHIPDVTGPRSDGLTVTMDTDQEILTVEVQRYLLAEFAGTSTRGNLILNGTETRADRLLGASYSPYSTQPALAHATPEDYAAGCKAIELTADGCSPRTTHT